MSSIKIPIFLTLLSLTYQITAAPLPVPQLLVPTISPILSTEPSSSYEDIAVARPNEPFPPYSPSTYNRTIATRPLDPVAEHPPSAPNPSWTPSFDNVPVTGLPGPVIPNPFPSYGITDPIAGQGVGRTSSTLGKRAKPERGNSQEAGWSDHRWVKPHYKNDAPPSHAVTARSPHGPIMIEADPRSPYAMGRTDSPPYGPEHPGRAAWEYEGWIRGGRQLGGYRWENSDKEKDNQSNQTFTTGPHRPTILVDHSFEKVFEGSEGENASERRSEH